MPPSKVDAATLARWRELLRRDYGTPRRTYIGSGNHAAPLPTLDDELRESWLAALQEEARGS